MLPPVCYLAVRRVPSAVPAIRPASGFLGFIALLVSTEILEVAAVVENKETLFVGIFSVYLIGAGISELPDKDQLILVYCRSGNRSKQASEKLVKLGYTNIIEIGGINSWPGETVTGDK